jgi:hypothetical protein
VTFEGLESHLFGTIAARRLVADSFILSLTRHGAARGCARGHQLRLWFVAPEHAPPSSAGAFAQ